MDLHIEHEIAAPLATIEAIVLDAALLARLPAYAPAVARAHERARRVRGDRVEREAVYAARFVPAALDGVIPRAWTTWIERTCWDRTTHAATFSIEPQIPGALRRRFACEGRYSLHAVDAARTRRRIVGALRVDAPWIGRRVEAALAAVIAGQFAGEAALITALAAGAG